MNQKVVFINNPQPIMGLRVVGDEFFPEKIQLNSVFQKCPMAHASGIPLYVKRLFDVPRQAHDNHIIVRLMSQASLGLASIDWQYGGTLIPAPPVLLARSDCIQFTVNDWAVLDDYVLAMLDNGPRGEVKRDDFIRFVKSGYQKQRSNIVLQVLYPKGTQYKINGLVSKTALNGKIGIANGIYHNQRVGIYFQDLKEQYNIKPQNLKKGPQEKININIQKMQQNPKKLQQKRSKQENCCAILSMNKQIKVSSSIENLKELQSYTIINKSQCEKKMFRDQIISILAPNIEVYPIQIGQKFELHSLLLKKIIKQFCKRQSSKIQIKQLYHYSALRKQGRKLLDEIFEKCINNYSFQKGEYDCIYKVFRHKNVLDDIQANLNKLRSQQATNYESWFKKNYLGAKFQDHDKTQFSFKCKQIFFCDSVSLEHFQHLVSNILQLFHMTLAIIYERKHKLLWQSKKQQEMDKLLRFISDNQKPDQIAQINIQKLEQQLKDFKFAVVLVISNNVTEELFNKNFSAFKSFINQFFKIVGVSFNVISINKKSVQKENLQFLDEKQEMKKEMKGLQQKNEYLIHINQDLKQNVKAFQKMVLSIMKSKK